MCEVEKNADGATIFWNIGAVVDDLMETVGPYGWTQEDASNYVKRQCFKHPVGVETDVHLDALVTETRIQMGLE